MTQIMLVLAWAWGQGLVVGFLAIVLSALAMRRRPAAGAAIAGVGFIATLTLTMLTPIPVPRWELRFENSQQKSIVRSDGSASADVTMATSMERQHSANAPDSGATFDFDRLRGVLATRLQTVMTKHHVAAEYVLGILVVGVLLSTLRVAYGVWSIMVLYKTSQVVVDRQLDSVVRELATRLGVQRIPNVHECGCLVSAAVVGWWRPNIVLPDGWREWSPAELRAVLAHELAHIARQDPVMRLLAACTVALQFGQPLVYWLRRQLILAQETAADEMAAAATCGRAEYLQALTKLALRQDGRPMDGPAAMLLPVFSGFLLRRIEMLRATDGSRRRVSPRTVQWCAIAILISAATSLLAVRGLAQSPQQNEDKPIRVSSVPAQRPKPGAGATDAHAAAATLFQRPAFDLATATVDESDGFIVRIGEILRRPELAEPARELQDGLAEGWRQAFPDGEVPVWSLRDIEYIAGDLRFIIKTLPQPTKDGHSNVMMFGSGWTVVCWQKPVDEQFVALLRVGAQAGAQKSHGGLPIVELPVIPALGPAKMCVCRLDDRRLLVAEESTLIARLDKLTKPTSDQKWRKTWEGVEGGLLSAIATDKEIAGPVIETGDHEARKFEEFYSARQYAIGVDWLPQDKGAGVVKVQLRFDDEMKAERFRLAFLNVVAEMAGQIEEDPTDQNSVGVEKLLVETLQNAKIETQDSDRGWQVNLQFAAAMDLLTFWQRL